MLKRLCLLSGNVCALPACEQVLAKSEWDFILGRIAHIRAQSPGGPRYDPTYPDVDHFDNLMILCPNCHTLIDSVEPDAWPVDRLETAKAEHERRTPATGVGPFTDEVWLHRTIGQLIVTAEASAAFATVLADARQATATSSSTRAGTLGGAPLGGAPFGG